MNILLARNKILILTKTATCIKFEFPICQCHANSVNTLFPCGFRVRPVIPWAGVPVVPWHPHILAVQLTLSQPRGPDYAHHITTGTPGFSDFPTALRGTCHLKIHLKIIEGFSKRKAQ